MFPARQQRPPFCLVPPPPPRPNPALKVFLVIFQLQCFMFSSRNILDASLASTNAISIATWLMHIGPWLSNDVGYLVCGELACRAIAVLFQLFLQFSC